jgi:phosphatidylserine/phosphatidylglycerophosphate/cardiolipin synthase-like enzyme
LHHARRDLAHAPPGASASRPTFGSRARRSAWTPTLPWLALLLALLLALGVPAQATTLEIHYAPNENLEAIDVAAIENADLCIDMAAYVLSDEAVIEALGDAADRGVAVRLYLDRTQYEGHAPAVAALIGRTGVSARIKPSGVLMHLKAYAVDGMRLRTGSGNFSRSGLSAQDNDALFTDDAATVTRFERDFERIFADGAPAPGS